MSMLIALLLSFLSLFATTVYAEDKAPQCLEERIVIEQLKQEVYELRGQVWQMLPGQIPHLEQARKASEAEQERLKRLLKPKPEEKQGEKK